MSLSRRQILAGGAGLTALAGFGFASRLLLSPRPHANPAGRHELASALFDALSDRDVAEAFVDYEHPLRQYHNRGVPTGGVSSLLLRRSEQALLVDLIHASLSVEGRAHLPRQMLLGLAGVQYGRLLFCGSPLAPPYQVLFTGAHLNLRIGGRNREGVAFGGPQVYGDQRGNLEVGLPGNAYRDQLERGQAMIAGLSRAERDAARCPISPVQTRIEVQGESGRFDGIPLADLSREKRARIRSFAELILRNYAEEDSAYAWECIERNGGLEAFHVADYDLDHQGGRNARGAPSQIFRLESPAAVFHYRGEPHLHAFINVAMDAEAPLSVGEVVTTNAAPLEIFEVKALFERVLRASTGEALAYYPTRLAQGRLRQGTIRTGDLYNLESWDDELAVAEISRDDLSPEAAADLDSRPGGAPTTGTIRVAVPLGVATYHDAYGIARARIVDHGGSLRHALIENVQQHGLRESDGSHST